MEEDPRATIDLIVKINDKGTLKLRRTNVTAAEFPFVYKDLAFQSIAVLEHMGKTGRLPKIKNCSVMELYSQEQFDQC